MYLLKRVQRHPKGLEGPLSPSQELEGWAHCAQSSSFTNHEILAQNFMPKFNLFSVMENMTSWFQYTDYGRVEKKHYRPIWNHFFHKKASFHQWQLNKLCDNPVNLLNQGCRDLEDINEVRLLSGVHWRTEVIVI